MGGEKKEIFMNGLKGREEFGSLHTAWDEK